MSFKRPLIGIPADRRPVGGQPYHMTNEKYLTAVVQAAGGMPVIIPALSEALEPNELVDSVDGLLFTGSPSNVEPHHYRGEPSEAGTLHDPHRDNTTLPLIPRAVAAGVPVLGVCRGFQEINVAYGGSLWQKLHEVPGHLDHRDDLRLPLEDQYAPAHDVNLTAGGLLSRLAHGAERLRVNSLHSQGVRELGARLVIEARADDGVIEAFRIADARRFAVAVQWHPEWQVMKNEFGRALFAEFGAASRERMAER